MIRQLQRDRDEADLMIGKVAAKLIFDYPDVPIFSLHDAIYVQESKIELVESAFAETCDQFGILLATEVSGCT